MECKEPILKDFVLSGIETRYYEPKEEYYIIFPIIELNKFKKYKITLKVNKQEINKAIEGNLSKIFFENNIPETINSYSYFIDPQTTLIRDEFNYNALTPISEKVFLFKGYQLHTIIRRFEDILIIPDIEKHDLRVKKQLLEKINY